MNVLKTTSFVCRRCAAPIRSTTSTAFCNCKFYRKCQVKKIILEYDDKVRIRVDGRLDAIYDGGERPLLFVGEGVEVAPTPAQGDRYTVTLAGEKFYGLRLVSFI